MTTDIRAAIEQLRASVEALPTRYGSNQWTSRRADGTGWPDAELLAGGAFIAYVDRYAVDHIVMTASPIVTEALIKWLTAIAEEADSLAEHDGFDPFVTIAGYAEARALAEAITHRSTT